RVVQWRQRVLGIAAKLAGVACQILIKIGHVLHGFLQMAGLAHSGSAKRKRQGEEAPPEWQDQAERISRSGNQAMDRGAMALRHSSRSSLVAPKRPLVMPCI